MTIRTLALASGATSVQDHRLALGAFMAPGASVLERRAGLYYYPGAADLVSAAALQANVTPFVAVVDGTSNSLQGQVLVVVDANVTLTFAGGEPSVARTDRVIVQIRDNTYDASGFTDARVLYLKGNTSTGAATALPASSLLLWEVTVPSGAASITFSSARTDKRQWTATPLRVPVNSSTERDALPAIPGFEVTRLDTGTVEQYWSGAWRVIAPIPTVSVLFARKPIDTTRSTMSATADPHLSVTVAANSVYIVDCFFTYAGDPASDFFWNYTAPSGATTAIAIIGLDTAAGSTAGPLDMFTLSAPGSSYNAGVGGSSATAAIPRGILVTAATPGTFGVNWSGWSGTAATTLKANSFIRLEKVT